VATTTSAFGRDSRQFVDDWTAQIIETARAEAFAEGRKEGFSAGRSDMEETVSRVDAALRNAVAQLTQMRSAAIEETIDAAFEVAAFVVGQTPHDDGGAVAARIRSAIADLDDEAMVIAIHPQDWDTVSAEVRLPNGVTMERDPSLRPGEARIAGRWATAELTREAALEVAREVLS
jgi:flagellar biosynthesis/type III secretory pathway protein FliH